MNYSINEKKALKTLGLSDFRHMSKDKIVQFMSLVPKMDPEVAKAAIDQFPEFKDMAIRMTDTLKEMIDATFASEKDSQDFFYESCKGMLITLEQQLHDESIDAKERAAIRDNMMQIICWIKEKDSEHKKTLALYFAGGIAFLGTLVGSAAALLGGNIKLPTSNASDDEDQDEKI